MGHKRRSEGGVSENRDLILESVTLGRDSGVRWKDEDGHFQEYPEGYKRKCKLFVLLTS